MTSLENFGGGYIQTLAACLITRDKRCKIRLHQQTADEPYAFVLSESKTRRGSAVTTELESLHGRVLCSAS